MSFRDIIASVLPPSTPRAQAKSPTPVAPVPPPQPRDQLIKSAASDPIAKLAAGRGLEPGEWQALAKRFAAADPAGREAIVGQMKAANFEIAALDGGRVVHIAGPKNVVTAVPATQQLRVMEMERRQVYLGDKLIATITVEDDLFTLERDGKVQRWNGATGLGHAADGKPIAPKTVPPVPNEAPRKPWSAFPPTKLNIPAYDGNDQHFARDFDAAVLKAGGKILDPLNADGDITDAFNCHSYSLSGGKGDLADPFSLATRPRWLNLPSYQLTTGNYGKLGPTQRAHPGDILVYMKDGGPTHTGIVRAVDADGNPSEIESKFGGWGRYVHPPFDALEAYGPPTEIYRPLKGPSPGKAK